MFNRKYMSYFIFRAGWTAPVSMYIFFLIGTSINYVLISFVVSLVAEQEKREGDFRFKHLNVRVSSEEIAFSGPPKVEKIKTDERLNRLIYICKR